MIDAILTNTVLPAISREFLTRTMAGVALNGVRLAVADGDFAYRFDDQRADTRRADWTHGAVADKGPRRRPRSDIDAIRCRTISGRPRTSTGPRGARLCRAVHYSACSPISRERPGHSAIREQSWDESADWQQPGDRLVIDEADEAVAAFQRIRVDPDHANAHNNLGVVLRQGKALKRKGISSRDP
jgi:hypothetical protein